jgi:hypothetical protein
MKEKAPFFILMFISKISIMSIIPYKKVSLKSEGRLELIDDETKFNNLSTSIYTSQLDSTSGAEYSSWFNYFKRQTPNITTKKNVISWVGENYKTVEKYIYDTNVSNASPISEDGKYKFNTVRNHLQTFCTILLRIDKHKFREYVRSHYKLSFEFGDKARELVQNQELSKRELENFITYHELVQKRNQLKDIFDKSKQLTNMNSIKNHMAYLVLCLNLRLDFLDMEIWNTTKEPPINTTNYLWMKDKDDMIIVINQDKVSHHEKAKGTRGMYPLKNEIINKNDIKITDGHGLMIILNDSTSSLPRNHVLIKLKDYNPKSSEHLPDATYNQSILKWAFKPRKPTQNTLRKSYINYFYNLPNTNINDHKAIAYRMRHSYSTASENYVKLNIDPDALPVITGSEVKLLPDKIPELNIKSKQLFNPAEYSKKYRDTHKDEVDKARKANYIKNKSHILATKIIWHLNQNLSKAPRKSSIDKYNLIQDPDTKLWSIQLP